jgi:hypothetical protein
MKMQELLGHTGNFFRIVPERFEDSQYKNENEFQGNLGPGSSTNVLRVL